MDVYDLTSYEQQVTCRTQKKRKKNVPKILWFTKENMVGLEQGKIRGKNKCWGELSL